MNEPDLNRRLAAPWALRGHLFVPPTLPALHVHNPLSFSKVGAGACPTWKWRKYRKTVPAGLIATILMIALGCAAGKPVLVLEPGVSLTGYRSIELAEVKDETGQRHDFDVVGELEQQLRSKFGSRGLAPVATSSPAVGTLTIRVVLVSYHVEKGFPLWPPQHYPGTTECIITASLTDKPTGRGLAQFVSHRAVNREGLFLIGGDRRILGTVAGDLADAVAKALRPE